MEDWCYIWGGVVGWNSLAWNRARVRVGSLSFYPPDTPLPRAITARTTRPKLRLFNYDILHCCSSNLLVEFLQRPFVCRSIDIIQSLLNAQEDASFPNERRRIENEKKENGLQLLSITGSKAYGCARNERSIIGSRSNNNNRRKNTKQSFARRSTDNRRGGGPAAKKRVKTVICLVKGTFFFLPSGKGNDEAGRGGDHGLLMHKIGKWEPRGRVTGTRAPSLRSEKTSVDFPVDHTKIYGSPRRRLLQQIQRQICGCAVAP